MDVDEAVPSSDGAGASAGASDLLAVIVSWRLTSFDMTIDLAQPINIYI
jgi:hypothetical protein